MEILGSTFDDSVFNEAKDRVCVSVTAYNAKVCEDQWFCLSEALDTDDPVEKQKVNKFRGDLALRQKDYQKAWEAYSSCLPWISDNNLSIRRDILEAMARCCSRMGQREQALDLAHILSKEATNTSHLTSILLLKVSIHQQSAALVPKVECLQQLCSLLPFNPWHWLGLGQTCVQLLTERREAAGLQGGGHTEEAELSEDRLWLKACTGFIRTRLLLRILRQQQASFVLQRSEKALHTSEEALQRLNPTESTVQHLTEVMSEDLVPEKMREDYQDGESLTSVCLQSFTERWWNKILLITHTHTHTLRPDEGHMRTESLRLKMLSQHQ
ncbi:uncharacterized protein C8orf76 homolog [Gouania willdenowi]|uniref:Uncharacterized protein n=1 Tax=Gouania willdenowi TaxID=441366 RepID=A0A8C5ETS0_GOUWI|nr:uncharacterized protein C8orf76 homolog [Gouania willdenowi]